MARGKSYIVSPGSQRLPLTGAHKIGPADPRERVDVTILLYGRARIERILDPQVFTRPIRQRTLLSRNEFEGRYGADPKSITLLQAFARENKLAVKEVSAARRTVILSGTVASMSAAFHVYLEEYEHAGVRFRGRIGSISIPSTLKDVVQGVFGLDNRPQANPHFRGLHKQADKADHMETVSYTPPQIAALYDFPSNVDGSGECIAFIELGGEVSLADLNTYWKRLKLTTTPKVTTVFVNGYRCDQAGHSTGPDGTVMSDIEVAGSIAPGAKIIVYFAENTDAGFLNAISTAVHDSTNRPSVISISWGAPE
jgi:kumamolisin